MPTLKEKTRTLKFPGSFLVEAILSSYTVKVFEIYGVYNAYFLELGHELIGTGTTRHEAIMDLERLITKKLSVVNQK